MAQHRLQSVYRLQPAWVHCVTLQGWQCAAVTQALRGALSCVLFGQAKHECTASCGPDLLKRSHQAHLPAGGGITQIVMPNLAERIQKNGTSQFMSWRWAFFLPGCMHIGSALAILAFGQVSIAEAASS